jgi:beta-N-acetylhexosaminidase
MFWNIAENKKTWVNGQISAMTFDEKIGQLVCEPSYAYNKVQNQREWLRKYPVGSVFVGSEVIDDQAEKDAVVRKCINSVQSMSRIPTLFCGDFEHGIGSSITGFTRLPDVMALGATHDADLAYEYGRIIAEEAKMFDVRWAFGPVSDLNVNHLNPVTNVRAIGDHPDHAVKMLGAIVRGMQEHAVAACPKHFPGDGTDGRNQHIVTSLNLLEKSDWDRKHGKVFKALIDVGAASIMIGHIGFPAYETMDPAKQLFRPATASGRIMTALLRKELGFKGIILTDALGMCGYVSWAGYEERILDSFNGGADVFLWPEPEKFFPLMKSALQDGRASMDRLEESVRRITAFKAWLGLDEKRSVPELSETAGKNRQISQTIAEKSLTVLRNHAGNVPLRLKAGAELLILVTPAEDKAIKPLHVFKKEFEDRSFRPTMMPLPEVSDITDIGRFECVFLVCNARPQYVVYPYNDYKIWGFMCCEKIRKRIILSFGTPYYLYETASADTYLNFYSDCKVSQRAAVKALFGEIPFTGRSPVGLKHCFDFGCGLPNN